jgi:hypothetical protein
MPPRSQIQAHRRDIAELVHHAQSDLGLILKRYSDPETARDALIIAIPKLVGIYGAAAATVGADWYADLRDAAGVRGRFTPVTAELPGTDRTDALARWGVGPLFSGDPDTATARSRLEGGLQRIIANADRETITVSAVEDRGAQGWTRSTSGGCNFCEELASIEWGQKVPDFESHDFCRCLAVPGF